MKKFGAFALSLVFASAFGVSRPFWATDEATAAQVLQDAKLTPTKLGGAYSDYSWTRCSTLNVTRFEAASQTGQKLSGYVCTTPRFYLNKPSSITFDKQ